MSICLSSQKFCVLVQYFVFTEVTYDENVVMDG